MTKLERMAREAVNRALADWVEFPYPEEKRKLREAIIKVARAFAADALRQVVEDADTDGAPIIAEAIAAAENAE